MRNTRRQFSPAMLLRRAAHIRPPRSPPLTMGSEEKPRLAQRSLGVTNRIWLIVGLIIVVLTLTHFILPSTSSQTAPVQKILKSKNYLNASQNDPNPFPFCPLYGPGDDIGNKYGALALSQSRMHLGSGARIQRVLQRALSGQPVTISIIGGSSKWLATTTRMHDKTNSIYSISLPWRRRRPNIA